MSRIYKVSTPEGFRLVEANSRNAAVNFVVAGLVKAEPITASELAAFIRQGVGVEVVPVPVAKEDGVPAFVKNNRESENQAEAETQPAAA